MLKFPTGHIYFGSSANVKERIANHFHVAANPGVRYHTSRLYKFWYDNRHLEPVITVKYTKKYKQTEYTLIKRHAKNLNCLNVRWKHAEY